MSIFVIFVLLCVSMSAHAFMSNDTIPEATLDTLVTIKEVDVRAKYMERDANGNLQVRVQGNPLAMGTTITSFLETIPGVMVDGGSLSIEGRGGTIIEMDGRQMPMSELAAIPLSLVSRIEVVPNAEGRYGINASGGVLRVHLRKIPGVIGSISNNNITDEHGFYEDCPILHFLLRESRHSLYSMTGVQWHDALGKSIRTIYPAASPTNATETYIREDATQFIAQQNLSYRYEFSDLTNFHLYGMLLSNHTESDYHYNTITDVSRTYSNSRYRTYSVGSRFDTSFGQEVEGRRHTLILQSNLVHTNRSRPEIYESTKTNCPYAKTLGTNFDITASLDLVMPHGGTLGTGAMIDYLNDLELHDGVSDPVFRNIDPLHTRNINVGGQGWVEYHQKIGSVNLYGKLAYMNRRMRLTDHNEGTQVEHHYHGLFPVLRLTWDLDEQAGNTFTFYYQSFYNTPNYNLYNPRITYISDNTYSMGNPNLRHAVTHRIQTLLYLGETWYFNAFFSYDNHPVISTTFPSPDRPGTYYMMPVNMGHQTMWYFSPTHTTWPVKKVWRMENVIVLRNDHHSYGGRSIDNPHIFLFSRHRLFVTKHFSLTLDLEFNTKSKRIDYEGRDEFSTTAGFNLSLLKGRMTVSGAAASLFAPHHRSTYWSGDDKIVVRQLTHPWKAQLYVSWNFTAGKKIRQIQMQQARGWSQSSTF